jgi:hypothetical protein
MGYEIQGGSNIEFPRIFDKCQHCGSTRRVAKMVTDNEIARGKVGKGLTIPLYEHRMTIVDLSKDVPTAPTIYSQHDICYDCGAEVCVRIDVEVEPIGI